MICKHNIKANKISLLVNCKHLCPDDWSMALRTGITRCAYGDELITVENTQYMEKCDGCHILRYYLGDAMKALCDGHLHCKICLINAKNSQKCQACDKRLNNEVTNEIEKFITFLCVYCKVVKDLNELVHKECCDILYCADCSEKESPTTFCLNCIKKIKSI